MRRFRATPLIVGLILLLHVAAMRAFMSADSQSVRILGREAGSACAFRQAFGIPCPNCGMMRSVVLFAHGHAAEAFRMNPAGPLFDIGLLVAAALLVTLGLIRWQPGAHARRWMTIATASYTVLYGAVLLTHWLAEIGLLWRI